jgi:predicted dehydrogenase
MYLLRGGLHVFIEKPLAPTEVEAQELVAAAEAHGRILQVGHVERFNPAFLAAAPHLASPQYISAERTSGYTGRSTDIGVVFDLMIHDIDLALALAQSEVERIDALGISILGGHEDMAQARLTFANGCVANLTASRASYVASRRMQVFSATGFAALDFATPAARLLSPSLAVLRGEREFDRLPPGEKQALRESLFVEHLPAADLPLERINAIQEELRNFAASIAAGRAPHVDGRQGLQAVSVAERVLREIAAHRWNTPEGRARGPFVRPFFAIASERQSPRPQPKAA